MCVRVVYSSMASFQLNVPYFIAALSAGLLYVYLWQPAPKVVVKFPSPWSTDVKYRDASDTCFKYTAEKVVCPADKAKVRHQPIDLDDA